MSFERLRVLKEFPNSRRRTDLHRESHGQVTSSDPIIRALSFVDRRRRCRALRILRCGSSSMRNLYGIGRITQGENRDCCGSISWEKSRAEASGVQERFKGRTLETEGCGSQS